MKPECKEAILQILLQYFVSVISPLFSPPGQSLSALTISLQLPSACL